MIRILSFVLTVGAVIGASQGQKLPVLKELPAEILFRVGGNSELVLDCTTVDKEAGIKYSWLKNGKPLTPNADVIQSSNDGTLIFKKPAKSDEGQYQCLAQTDLGTASSRTVNVKRTYIDVPKVDLKKHKPNEGNIFKLDCSIPNSYPKPEIVWLYQYLSDASISRTIINQRITTSPDGDLYFTSVTKEDASPVHKYVCTAKSPAVDDYVVLAEHVIEDVVSGEAKQSELVKQYVSGDMTAKVGDVTMIYCIYGGTPLAHPEWYKDGRNVNGDPKDRVTRYNRSAGKRLLIKETWISDQGEYTCIVDNEVAKTQKNTIRLTVVSAPKFVRERQPTLIVKAGEDVTIACQAAGVPAPELSWTYNAQTLPPGDRITLNKSSRGNTTVADLTIKNVLIEDKGYYGCKGINDNGKIYAETLVYVQ
ncbi:hemolin-like [Nymphalis io]|uniref:hemolin-like n=1 Tax=Inachis io TaxID=171585 RepID=UPI0021681327|nr:hemolin-like [Nymphalis io]XP_050359621.1 hemolin-like [Nymphalis io]XP_050359622.1 hemolin-like [Nymphalis io]